MAVAALWLVLFGVLHVLTRMTVFSLFSIAPLIVATVADERRTVIFAGAAVALSVGIGPWYRNAADGVYWTRVAQALDTLMTVVHRHTGGHGHDDMALLLLEHGGSPPGSADGHPAEVAVKMPAAH